MSSILHILSNGDKMWLDGHNLHREDGPAYEGTNGRKEWWINNKCHREDGPAVESSCGIEYWYYHGKYIKCSSQQEFEKLIKLQAFW